MSGADDQLRAKYVLDRQVMHQVLDLPAGVRVVSMHVTPDPDQVHVVVEGASIPVGSGHLVSPIGHMRAAYKGSLGSWILQHPVQEAPPPGAVTSGSAVEGSAAEELHRRLVAAVGWFGYGRAGRALRAVVELHAPTSHTAWPGNTLVWVCGHCAGMCHSRSGLGCDDPRDGAYPCQEVKIVAGELGVESEVLL